ncbi:K02A2.6-like [Cordylochernes scorpioides]|uniref:RNA-directed DNA polymerase n=1 Tax=Cordylochernes scorpioides TaxID=51811 RepID=A0ABY6L7X7_9ARAC|nr:K02A2.6-like [Cordylochernes scorpioides]
MLKVIEDIPHMTVYIETYGCQMNVNDTEIASSILTSSGFTKTSADRESASDKSVYNGSVDCKAANTIRKMSRSMHGDVTLAAPLSHATCPCSNHIRHSQCTVDTLRSLSADVILLMTCSIREGAEQKIWRRLEALRALKRKRSKNLPPLKVGVLGCMAERLKHKLVEQEKMVDVVAGPDSYRDLPRLLAVPTGESAVNVMLSLDETYADVMPVRQDPNSPSAFVSIMRGCNNMCTYCIVPFTRGRERSRPLTSILDEVRYLSDKLIRDRIVVGVRDKALSERMQLDTELTLEKAVKMVRQQEAVRQQQVDLQRPSTSQKVSAVEDSSNLDDDEGECRRRWTAEIQVNGKKVKFKLDSQADVTCVPLCLFKKIMGQQRLVESDINIRAAEFSELQTVGMFISTLRNGNYVIKEKIYVIRRLGEPLLSRRACELLNLARRIEVVATRINPIKEFPEVFEGLGQIGNPYEIKLKPGAKPYAVHTPRRVPIPLMEKLKTRLEELEKAGIIAQVNVATEWCAPTVIAGKPNGDIRLCVELSRLNEHVQREVHPMPVLEHMLGQLGEARFFSKLDANTKIEAVAEMPAPTDVHGVRRFLGMVNHLGRFVENLSEIMAPLNQLLVKGQDFVWDCSQERAFRKLKELLTTQPILAAYDVRKPTMVSSDASSYGLGAVLKQEGKNGIWRPVAYSSRTMTPTEKRYAQIEKEALAITWACERFQDFLLGKRFRIETDHKPLIPLFSTKELSSLTPNLQRFRMRMMRFGFEIVHIPGKELLDADALSRQPLLTSEGGEDERPTSAHINAVLSCITDKDEMLTKIFEAQQEDTTLKAVVNYLEQGWPDKKKMSPALLSYWHVKDELGVQNGLLMRGCRLVIPASMKLEILDKLHAGHFGITKTRLRARETVWWPGISEEIAETVRKCSVCIQEAVSKHEPLIPTNFPTRPWQKIGMDLFKFENKWYLVVIDYYSRFPEMVQLDRLTASVVVRSCKSMFARHGIPETVVSDNGTQFGAAREFANFARQYGFQHVTSSPRFPQSNGMAEAGVKIAKLILKKNQDPSLGLLEYRSTPLENGYSPAELLMGRKLRTTLPIAPENLNPKLVDSQTLKRKEGRRRKDMKSRYDRRCGATDMEELSEGDTVWITDMRIWGIVKQKASTPRSYMVDTPVGTLCRNRFHLRKGYAVQYPADPSTPAFSGEELVENEKTPVVDYPSNDSEDGQIRTRSGRIVKPGVKEITLLGQNVNSYRDTAEESVPFILRSPPQQPQQILSEGFSTVYKLKSAGLRFADLLHHVAQVNPEIRIRFTSPHPKDFPDEV